MFCEELDYWLVKLLPPPWSHVGLMVRKEPENYIKWTQTPWRSVMTTLDYAYLEIRQSKVQIAKDDPFFVEGDFGGKFAIYGSALMEESRITECDLRGSPGKTWLSMRLTPRYGGKMRRLKQFERKLLNNLTQARG